MPPDQDSIKIILVVAALITREDGRILITQRPRGTVLEAKWEFPGGKVEPGEPPREALVRECREELGITIRAGSIYETVYTKNHERAILLLFYTAEILEGKPQSLEANAFAWATPEEMEGFDIIEPDRPLVQAFRQNFPHFQPSKTM